MLNMVPTGVSKCPVENIEYAGTCPITNCPANLCSLTNGHTCGCYFEKCKSTNLHDIAQTLKITYKEASSRYATGMRELERVVSNITGEADEKCCPKCGWKNCKNSAKCAQRAAHVALCLNRYPLNIAAFGVSPDKVWKIAEKQLENPTLALLPEKTILFYKSSIPKKGKKQA